ncbi:hypothetical protein [Oceanobacillus jeddahense]|uniref:HTH cro/C1-type domain-containing protein n=1 Tax=Oceanobacillus jeddahense TaxID=1462527 RepID=A0ABY5JWG2_9BACI|nr:hypothetical protein [Oceanobacillus jeddahense]UUI04723.1 hypothetical protein NP439_08835 [Oceanobacillus jeddahense]
MTAKHKIIRNIEALLRSEITAYKIQQLTGINRSQITRLKKGDIEIKNISLENALKLSNLWEEIKEDNSGT